MQYIRADVRISIRFPASAGVAMHISSLSNLFVCRISNLSPAFSTKQTGILLVPGTTTGYTTSLYVPFGTVKLGGNSTLNVAAQATGGALSYGPAGTKYVIISQNNSTITDSFKTLGGIVGGASPAFTVKYLKGGVSGVEVTASVAGGPLNQPADTVLLSYTGAAVTPVTVADFTATPEGAGVRVSWTSVSEFQNAGFNLYRRGVELRTPVSGPGAWTRINPALIAGRITNPDAKAYSFYDWAAAGSYEYKLESVSIKNEVEAYAELAGPVTAEEFADISAEGIDSSIASLESAHSARIAQTARDLFDPFIASLSVRPASTTGLARYADGRLVMAAASVTENPEIPTAVTHQAAASSATAAAASEPAVGARWFAQNSPTAATSFTGVKVVYDESGVLFIPQSSLPAGFNVGHLALQREGRAFTALAVTQDTDPLGAGLVVYAPGYRDEYTNKDALFFRRTATPTSAGQMTRTQGLFAPGKSAANTSAAVATSEYHDVYFDFNIRPYTFEPWFSNKYLTATSTSGTSQSFTLDVPNYAESAPATLTVNLWSLTPAAIGTENHALQVLVNGAPAGQASWSGGDKMMQLTFEITSGLRAGANEIQLITPPIDGVESQLAFVHSMSVSYWKQLNGGGDVVNVSSASSVYEVSGLPTANAWVVDTRFADRAALVPYETQTQADGTFRLRFNAAPGGTGRYLVVPVGQENRPLSVVKRAVKPIASGLKYIATGPDQFKAGVQPLIAARTKEGLRGAFADQEALFDYYNYGRYGPAGIQKMARSARPQFLLLVGRTTYDYLNYSGANVDPLCPSFLVATNFWSQTTSDSMFGDLGRGYPEIAVGRLPVNNAGELSTAVQRILTYKGPQSSGARLHAVADRDDPTAGLFGAQNDAIAQASPDLTFQRNYLGATYQTSPEVTAALLAAANGGADWLLYTGHGNSVRLGKDDPRILQSDGEIDTVKNLTGNVVLLQSTCAANWMARDVAGFRSIAIQALTQPQGGVSASIGSSTYVNSATSVDFMAQLLKTANTGGSMRWGTALMKTQQWAAQKGGAYFGDLSKTEQIFGDPAMPVFTPATRGPAHTGGSSSGSGTSSAPAAGTF